MNGVEVSKKRRIALITESKERKTEATPAHLFYYSKNSRWVSRVIDYMIARNFNKNDIYFLSYYDYQIFNFEQLVHHYGETDDPKAKERLLFAEKIISFLVEKYSPEDTLVELHLAKSKYDKLIQKLEELGYEYIIYADGEPLAVKPLIYEDLIEECETKKLKEIQREKLNLIKIIPNKTPEEAKKLYDACRAKAQLFGVEHLIEELRISLKDHWQAQKAVHKAKKEALDYIGNEDDKKGLELLFNSVHNLSDLMTDVDYFENLKSKYGRTISKIQRYLIKVDYLLQKELKIRSSLLKLQIDLIS